MHVIGISIPRFRDRYTYLTEHLRSHFGDEFEIVGVDGSTLTPAPTPAADLSPGQIGCALSHVAAYKRIVDLDLPRAFIVEDDCVLPPDIKSLIEQLERVIKPGEAIQLYNWSPDTFEISTRDSERAGISKLYYPMLMRGIGTTTAYIITREAAEKLIDINREPATVADDWSFFQTHGGVSAVRVLHPSPVKLMPFESRIVRSGGGIVARMKRSALVQYLLSLRRLVLFSGRQKNLIFVDQPSPFRPTP